MINSVLYIFLGLIAGSLSGLLGIGGGIIIVPTFVYLFKFSQHKAQGTSLALLALPLGLLGAYEYYKKGNVDVKVVLLMAIPFLIGALLGGKICNLLSAISLRKIFAVLLFLVSLKMFFQK